MSDNQFVDEVYESMDDISKLIEPFEFKANTELAEFPDEVEITPDRLYELACRSGGYYFESWSTGVNSLVYENARRLNLEAIVSETLNNSNFTTKIFEIVTVPDLEDGVITFDTVTKTISGGKVILRKKSLIVEDADIESRMITILVQRFNSEIFSPSCMDKKRLNEVANLFGAKEACKERAWKPKIDQLRIYYTKMIDEKRLPIKDMELFKRFVEWNINYIKHGNLPSFANITRLKIMLKSGLPIYSVKEDET